MKSKTESVLFVFAQLLEIGRQLFFRLFRTEAKLCELNFLIYTQSVYPSSHLSILTARAGVHTAKRTYNERERAGGVA